MDDLKIRWPSPPSVWSLAGREVHTWAIGLGVSGKTIDSYSRILSADETQRAERFRFERDRRRFILARGSLRAILGAYAHREPASLNFAYTPRGKPTLADPKETLPLQFNLTHSDEIALLAVTQVGAVGIDVERIRELNDADGIAGRFFSPRESQGLAALPASEKPAAFFNLWTRKEAWLKATGDGISESLDKVGVSFFSSEPARLISLPEVAGPIQEWSLFDLQPAQGFVGALAIRDSNVKVIHWNWSHSAIWSG